MLKKIKGNPISYKFKEVPIGSITIWEEAQARTLDKDGIDSLAASIQQEGLQNPLMVQRDGTSSYLLMAGQRRLAALRRLGAKTAPVLVLDRDSMCDVTDAKAVSIIENMQRNDMTAAETSKACMFLAEKLGKAKAAKALGIKSSALREYIGFGAVPDRIKQMVPRQVSKRDAIKICRTVPTEAGAVEIIERTARYDGAKKRRYLNALVELGPNATHQEIQSLANSFRARQNLAVRVSPSQARGLAKLSKDSDMEPSEMAGKIVSDYLKRRGIA